MDARYFGLAVSEYVFQRKPDADSTRDYRVEWSEAGSSQSEGPHIAEWNLPFPEPTPLELEEAALEAQKRHKVVAFASRAIEDLSPLFTESAGRDETALLIAAHVLAICEVLEIPADPRLSEVVATGEKALSKKAQVESAATLEELESVEWEE